ncbi:hypothetical protein HanRHA438_Chr02g0058081 [Helianthus annuus]|nr:hypothetical protein HanRHA438_Chr02g0058081 [Helianthus annuus]
MLCEGSYIEYVFNVWKFHSVTRIDFWGNRKDHMRHDVMNDCISLFVDDDLNNFEHLLFYKKKKIIIFCVYKAK